MNRSWIVHLWLAHPACWVLRKCGRRKWAFRLHDATMPDWQGHIWDLNA